MTRFFLLCIGILFLFTAPARAQSTVSVIGPITPGDCAIFNSTTIIKDSGGTGCTGSGSGVPGGTNGQIQFNNSGNFGGFTANGDATINTGTGAVSVTANAVTNAKAAQMPADTAKCNPTGSLANAQDCTTPVITGLSLLGSTSADALDITENLNGAAHFGLSIAQTVTGNLGGAFNYNLINITSDNAQAGGGFANGFTVQNSFGGAAMTGGRQGIQIGMNQTAVTNASNTNRNYVGAETSVTSSSGDGGTGTTLALAKGAYYGANFNTVLTSGATNTSVADGAEIDVTVQTGASVALKSALTLAYGTTGTTDVAGGSIIDSMLSMFRYNGPGAGQGISFNDEGGQTGFPVATGGTLIAALAVNAHTVANGIDFSAANFTITGSAFKSTGFSVDGTGNTLVGHLGQGVAATIGACGTTPSITGADGAGLVFIGTGSPASCTINFGKTWASAPSCIVKRQSSAATDASYTVSTTAITITSPTSSTNYNWLCLGQGTI